MATINLASIPFTGMKSRKHPTKAGYILCQNYEGGKSVGSEYEMQWPPKIKTRLRQSDIASRSDWQLVCDFARLRVTGIYALGHAQSASQTRKVVEHINKRIWALQDGYGCAGFTPVQGWDWSGIRDSTEGARKRMGVEVRRLLNVAGVTKYTVEEMV